MSSPISGAKTRVRQLTRETDPEIVYYLPRTDSSAAQVGAERARYHAVALQVSTDEVTVQGGPWRLSIRLLRESQNRT